MRYWVRRDSNPQCHRPRIYSPLSNRCSTNPSVLSLWKMGQERLELSILSAEASKTPMYTNSNIDPTLGTCAYSYIRIFRFSLYSFQPVYKVQLPSLRNLLRGYPERNYPYSTPQKRYTGFEPVLSVWRTDVLAANTNTAYKSRSRENRTLTLFRTWFWVTRVYLFRHRPKCFRE